MSRKKSERLNRRNRPTKPRTTALVLDMGKPVVITSSTHDVDGSLILSNPDGIQIPINAFVKTTYSRSKGDKVLHDIPIPPTELTHDPNVALTRFDWVFPVDTNSSTGEQKVSFVGGMQTKVLQEKPGKFVCKIYRKVVIELHNVTVSPERLGWWFVVRAAADRPLGSRIALLVDSELTELAAINRHEKPVIGDYVLPEGIELLYASTDAGGGYIANDLLRSCDGAARKVARLPDTEKLSPLRESEPGAPFSHIRVFEGA